MARGLRATPPFDFSSSSPRSSHDQPTRPISRCGGRLDRRRVHDRDELALLLPARHDRVGQHYLGHFLRRPRRHEVAHASLRRASRQRDHKMRALAAITIWLVATTYSFAAAIGFAALNRDTTTSEREQQAQLQKTLETMKQSPRWQSSAACADATAPQSKQFCATLCGHRSALEKHDPRGRSAIGAHCKT